MTHSWYEKHQTETGSQHMEILYTTVYNSQQKKQEQMGLCHFLITCNNSKQEAHSHRPVLSVGQPSQSGCKILCNQHLDTQNLDYLFHSPSCQNFVEFLKQEEQHCNQAIQECKYLSLAPNRAMIKSYKPQILVPTTLYYYYWWFLSLIFSFFCFLLVFLSVIPTPWTHMVLDVLTSYLIWLY